MIGEAFGDRLAQRRLVVDEQQMFLRFQPFSRCGGILTPPRSEVNDAVAAGTTAARFARSDNSSEPSDMRQHASARSLTGRRLKSNDD